MLFSHNFLAQKKKKKKKRRAEQYILIQIQETKKPIHLLYFFPQFHINQTQKERKKKRRIAGHFIIPTLFFVCGYAMHTFFVGMLFIQLLSSNVM